MTARDRVVRAISEDGSFRVIAAVTTDTVRGVLAAQSPPVAVAPSLAGLVTGAVLVRETMAPTQRVQVLWQGARGQLVADSFPDGSSRGLAQLRGGSREWAGGGSLRVMRSLPSGRVLDGTVEVPDGAHVADAIGAYMDRSEQITCAVGSAVRFEEERVVAAAGYVVQLLPEMERDALAGMVERLETLGLEARLDAELDAELLLSALLAGVQYTQLQSADLRFGCTCTEDRVVAGLATLGAREIADIVVKGEVLEVDCDYCHREYRIDPARVARLLHPGGSA